jgi:hypothetical protein
MSLFGSANLAMAQSVLSACGESSTPQQTSGQAKAASEEQARKDADEKAWADALRAGTVAAFNAYVQSFGSGAHVAEARARLATLEEKARKQADDRAWTDAARVGTATAFNA